MGEAMFLEDECVCRRRGLMYQDTVREAVFPGGFRGNVAEEGNMAAVEASHALLSARPLLPEVLLIIEVFGRVLDVSKRASMVNFWNNLVLQHSSVWKPGYPGGSEQQRMRSMWTCGSLTNYRVQMQSV